MATSNTKENVAVKLNKEVKGALTVRKAEGFIQAFQIAEATQNIRQLLTKEVMSPIMSLQGTKLGFRTDRDDKNGYPVETVRDCLIEAVLTGVQPTGNQFNIIASNCYITKEGFKFLLQNYSKYYNDDSFEYKIIPGVPEMKSSGAIINMEISYVLNGEKKSQNLLLPIKVNKFMGSDAVIGKATRKARAWLYNHITDSEISDGDIVDQSYEEIESKPLKRVEKSQEKKNEDSDPIVEWINTAKRLEELYTIEGNLETDVHRQLYSAKKMELSKNK